MIVPENAIYEVSTLIDVSLNEQQKWHTTALAIEGAACVQEHAKWIEERKAWQWHEDNYNVLIACPTCRTGKCSQRIEVCAATKTILIVHDAQPDPVTIN